MIQFTVWLQEHKLSCILAELFHTPNPVTMPQVVQTFTPTAHVQCKSGLHNLQHLAISTLKGRGHEREAHTLATLPIRGDYWRVLL